MSGALPVQTWFSSDDMVAVPGERLTLPLSIHNLGQSSESYTIVPAGLSASWTTIERCNVTLFGGSRDVIEDVVMPPAMLFISVSRSAKCSCMLVLSPVKSRHSGGWGMN